MSIRNWGRCQASMKGGGAPLRRRLRPWLEYLEDRLTPAIVSPSNPGFEDGVAGWIAQNGAAGSVAVVSSHVTDNGLTFTPRQGANFALLGAANNGSFARIESAPFVANEGDVIEFSAFFDAQDYLPYDDFGEVRLLRGEDREVMAIPYRQSVGGVGDYGISDWTYVQHTVGVGQGGVYRIEARVTNLLDGALDSYLGIDHIGPIAANGGTYSSPEGVPVQLHAVGTSTLGLTLTYAWDLDGDGSFETTGQDVTLPSAGLDGPNILHVPLKVSDANGNFIQTVALVQITNQAPSIRSVTLEPNGTVYVGTPLTLHIDAADPAGANDPLFYDVYAPDGSLVYLEATPGQPPGDFNIAFLETGLHTVVIQVDDGDGGMTTRELNILVESVPVNVPPHDLQSADHGTVVAAGDIVDFDVTFADPDAESSWQVTIAYTNTRTGEVQSESFDVTNRSINREHLFAVEGTYNITVTIADGEAAVSKTFVINVFRAREAEKMAEGSVKTAVVEEDGAEITANTVANETPDAPGAPPPMKMDVALSNAPQGASLFVASYTGDPSTNEGAGETATGNSFDLIKVGGASPDAVVPQAFFDIRVGGLDGQDQDVRVVCEFEAEVAPDQMNAIGVFYWNGSEWSPVVADPNFPVERNAVAYFNGSAWIGVSHISEVPSDALLIRVKVRVTYTANSTPSVFDLTGTVFTVALPAPPAQPTTTPVATPVASLTAIPPQTLTTTFSSASQVSLVVRVSSGSDLSNSRTEASTLAATLASSAGVGDVEENNRERNIAIGLDLDWLLDRFGPRGEDNPIRPAADGGEEGEGGGGNGQDLNQQPETQPQAPAVPEEASRLSPLDAAFVLASQDLVTPPIDMLQMLPSLNALVRESRISVAWGLVAGLVGTGGFGCRSSERRKNRPV